MTESKRESQLRAALALIPACHSCYVIWDYAQFSDRLPQEEARKKRCGTCWERATAAIEGAA